jgi:hypothetical protein
VRTATFRIDTDDHRAEITVKEASVLDQMMLQTIFAKQDVRDWQASLPVEMRIWGTTWGLKYATLRAYTISIKNDEGKVPLSKDMSLEEFLALNAGVAIVWEEEIGKLNPYLSPRRLTERKEGESREEAGEENGATEA